MGAGYRTEKAPPLDLHYLRRIDWWSRVAVGKPGECWEWRLSLGSHGYGQTWDGVTTRVAHRVAWTLHHGRQIPGHKTIDHLCFNKVCCNPAHLRLLDNIANAANNRQSRREECVRGHPFDEPNTYVDPRGHRRCRACARIRSAAAPSR